MAPSGDSSLATFALLLKLIAGWAIMRSPSYAEALTQDFLSFTFFLHDNLLTPTDTSTFVLVPPLQPPTFTPTDSYFGLLAVLDDSMTLDPDPSSLEIGRGRGIYVFDVNSTLPKGAGFEFLWTAEFNEASGYGEGSTLTFKGFDRIFSPVREIAIVGGTGKFRLARGWAVITTYSYTATGDVSDSGNINGYATLNITANVFYGFG